MAVPFRHIFICLHERPPGHPKDSCSQRGSFPVWEEMKKQVEELDLIDQIKVTSCGCLGTCSTGPSMVIYPEGVWYQGVKPEDVSDILGEHIMKGNLVDRLIIEPSNQSSDFLRSKKPIEELDQ